jgi:hypothetical protein
MPSWTLANLISQATAALGNRLDITLSTASFLMNEAHRQVYDAVDMESAEALAVSSTTSGEGKITLPTDFREIINLSNLSASPPDVLTQIEPDKFDSRDTVGGVPTKYVQYSTWLEVTPKPDSAYSLQLRYRTQATDMVALTALPSVDTQYRYAVFLKGTELLADSVLDEANSSLYRNKYISYVNSVPSKLARRQKTREGMRVQLRRNEY